MLYYPHVGNIVLIWFNPSVPTNFIKVKPISIFFKLISDSCEDYIIIQLTRVVTFT